MFPQPLRVLSKICMHKKLIAELRFDRLRYHKKHYSIDLKDHLTAWRVPAFRYYLCNGPYLFY